VTKKLGALILLVLAGLAPAKAEARRSTCAAAHSRTVMSNSAVRIYVRRGHEFACAYRNGRRFELGRGSEFFRDGAYSLEHVHLSGAKVAYTVSQDGVDYTVSEVWLRDVRKGRNLVAGASPVVREAACAPGDDRAIQNLVLAPNGHLAWTTTYSCAPGITSYRDEVVVLKPGAPPRLLDSGPESTLEPQSLGLAETSSRVYWTHGATVRKADI
jgi:hypothetical protein